MSQWPFSFENRADENLGLKGWIHFSHKDKDGVLIGEYDIPNTVANTGLAQTAGLLNGVVTDFFEYVAIGTGTTAPAAGNTALGDEATRSSATTTRTTTTQTNDTAQLVNTFNFVAGSAITESGIFDSSSAGTMLCRATFAAINVASGDSLQTTWKVAVS